MQYDYSFDDKLTSFAKPSKAEAPLQPYNQTNISEKQAYASYIDTS